MWSITKFRIPNEYKPLTNFKADVTSGIRFGQLNEQSTWMFRSVLLLVYVIFAFVEHSSVIRSNFFVWDIDKREKAWKKENELLLAAHGHISPIKMSSKITINFLFSTNPNQMLSLTLEKSISEIFFVNISRCYVAHVLCSSNVIEWHVSYEYFIDEMNTHI